MSMRFGWFFVVALLFLMGCGGAQYAGQADMAPMASMGGSTTASPQAVSAEFDGDEVGGRLSADGGSSAPSGELDRKLVKNGSVVLQVRDEDDFEPTVEAIAKLAAGLDGYVAQQTSSSITFKVPSGRLDEALTAIEQLGKVKHRDIRAMDVTARFYDMQSRIENLRKIRARLQELVAAGTNVKEILEVEKELNRITLELESMEGQMRLLSNQIAFAAVTVSLQEKVTPGPVGWVFYGAFHAVKWLFVWD